MNSQNIDVGHISRTIQPCWICLNKSEMSPGIDNNKSENCRWNKGKYNCNNPPPPLVCWENDVYKDKKNKEY